MQHIIPPVLSTKETKKDDTPSRLSRRPRHPPRAPAEGSRVTRQHTTHRTSVSERPGWKGGLCPVVNLPLPYSFPPSLPRPCRDRSSRSPTLIRPCIVRDPHGQKKDEKVPSPLGPHTHRLFCDGSWSTDTGLGRRDTTSARSGPQRSPRHVSDKRGPVVRTSTRPSRRYPGPDTHRP